MERSKKIVSATFHRATWNQEENCFYLNYAEACALDPDIPRIFNPIRQVRQDGGINCNYKVPLEYIEMLPEKNALRMKALFKFCDDFIHACETALPEVHASENVPTTSSPPVEDLVTDGKKEEEVQKNFDKK